MSKVNERNNEIIEEFRANGGTVGGAYEGLPIVIVHSKGAKTGVERVNPMVYLHHDDRIFVFAAKGGADTNPDWYHNFVANPDVTIEIGTETLPARAREIHGDERDKIFGIQLEVAPQFARIAANTSRVIPVMELVR